MSEKEKDLIARNLKFLRTRRGLTQQELAESLSIKRSSIGAYEESRANPKYDTLQKIAEFFDVSIDHVVTADLAEIAVLDIRPGANTKPGPAEANIRVLVSTHDTDQKPNIEFVPLKASAGYLNGFADPEYIGELPKFQLPMLTGGSYRAFEIRGESMLPLKSGTIIIGEYIEDWRSIKDGQTYVFVTESEGVVYKRAYSHVTADGGGDLELRSDNKEFPAFRVDIRDVREVWRAKMYISNQFPEPDLSNESLLSMIMNLQQEVNRLKDK